MRACGHLFLFANFAGLSRHTSRTARTGIYCKKPRSKPRREANDTHHEKPAMRRETAARHETAWQTANEQAYRELTINSQGSKRLYPMDCQLNAYEP